MPNTTNYSFTYESPGSLPGTTLTGGQTGASPILAVEVDSALAAVELKTDANTTSIGVNAADIDAAEADIVDLLNWTRSGTQLVSFTGVSSFSTSVNFGFTFPAFPRMTVDIASGAGETARWEGRAFNITTTSFTLFMYSSDNTTDTWSNIPVTWIATYRP